MQGTARSRLDARIAEHPDQDALAQAFHLAMLCRGLLQGPSYATSSEWASLVTPTEAGQELLGLMSDGPSSTERGQAVQHAALFRLFHHHDFLVDVPRTDVMGLKRLVERDLMDDRVRLPYRFGRLLYDRFNDTVDASRVHHLESDEAWTFLDSSPTGVYQYGELLTGPLGLLSSTISRWLPASAALPLWHCSDPGCRARHNVDLWRRQLPENELYSQLVSTAELAFGPFADATTSLKMLHRRPEWSDGRPFYDLPAVLAEGFVANELRILLSALLQSRHGSELRGILEERGESESLASGSPHEVASRLDEATLLQLLLTIADGALIETIELQVAKNNIHIPFNEVRRARLAPPRLHRDRATEVSSLGARSIIEHPLALMTSAVWQAYESSNMLQELQWRMDRSLGIPKYGDLVDFAMRTPPTQVVDDLVLSSAPVTIAVADRLGISTVEGGELPPLANRLLWRLGFNPPRYSEFYTQLRERVSHFRLTLVEVGAVRDEADRERIRSAGVNLFVSMERFLEDLVAFNVWLLASDHFLDTSFVYERATAVSTVAATLGDHVMAGGVELPWAVVGGNNLGTLVAYANAAKKWMQMLPDASADGYERPAEDLPHFAEREDLKFTFAHTQLWADADDASLRAHTDLFSRIVDHLNRSQLAKVRNGIDHDRSEAAFPSVEEMISCVTWIESAVSAADEHRLVPKELWLVAQSRDRFGRLEFELIDYRGHSTKLLGPPTVSAIRSPGFSAPYLVAPGDLIGLAGCDLVLAVRGGSEHSDYWKGYPRRRHIPARVPETPTRSAATSET